MGAEIVMKDARTAVIGEQGQSPNTSDISVSGREHISSGFDGKKKRVTMVMPSGNAEISGKRKFTQEQLQNEFDYMQAERITGKLLEKGLITVDEFEKIMDENKKTFPTFLSPLL